MKKKDRKLRETFAEQNISCPLALSHGIYFCHKAFKEFQLKEASKFES